MNEREMANALAEMLGEMAYLADDEVGVLEMSIPHELANTQTGIENARSYDEAGVMTTNAGFVIRMRDGSEFQVTVVQSK